MFIVNIILLQMLFVVITFYIDPYSQRFGNVLSLKVLNDDEGLTVFKRFARDRYRRLISLSGPGE